MKKNKAWVRFQFCILYFLRRTFSISKKEASCVRCGRTNLFHSQVHWTKYRSGSHVTALCKKCWRELKPDTRLPYYRELYTEWIRMGMAEKWGPWYLIESAVLNGK